MLQIEDLAINKHDVSLSLSVLKRSSSRYLRFSIFRILCLFLGSLYVHPCCDIAAVLQEAADEAQSKASEEGAFGQGTSRYLDAARLQAQLPAGAAWHTVRVKYYRYP